MLKLMWVDEKPMWIPVTEQEDAERVAMMEAVRNIPEIKPEKIADNAGYIGKHAENVSVYDAMMAEIMGEKDARLRKYMRKHEIRNDGKPVRKEKRKSYEKEKCYQCSHWNGWDIVRNVRIAEKIRTDAEDWKLEQDAIAEEEEWERFNRELEEFDRKWREEAEAEQRRMREYRKLRELHEWLKYA